VVVPLAKARLLLERVIGRRALGRPTRVSPALRSADLEFKGCRLQPDRASHIPQTGWLTTLCRALTSPPSEYNLRGPADCLARLIGKKSI